MIKLLICVIAALAGCAVTEGTTTQKEITEGCTDQWGNPILCPTGTGGGGTGGGGASCGGVCSRHSDCNQTSGCADWECLGGRCQQNFPPPPVAPTQSVANSNEIDCDPIFGCTGGGGGGDSCSAPCYTSADCLCGICFGADVSRKHAGNCTR